MSSQNFQTSVKRVIGTKKLNKYFICYETMTYSAQLTTVMLNHDTLPCICFYGYQSFMILNKYIRKTFKKIFTTKLNDNK